MRFQKRVKILPGITLNLSKKGVSTSVGTTGARVTFGHGKRRTTVGIPGTGISHTEVQSAAAPPPQHPQPKSGWQQIGAAVGWIFLAFAAILTVAVGILAALTTTKGRRK